MGVQSQYYLICGSCGVQFVARDGERFGETPEEIRDLAVDEGWSCYVGPEHDDDRCPNCPGE